MVTFLRAPFVLVIIPGHLFESVASVWIEKMMKVENRPQVSEDESKQKLYWFLSDSFQMYMFGIPIYLVGSFSSKQDYRYSHEFGVCAGRGGRFARIVVGCCFRVSLVCRAFVSCSDGHRVVGGGTSGVFRGNCFGHRVGCFGSDWLGVLNKNLDNFFCDLFC